MSTFDEEEHLEILLIRSILGNSLLFHQDLSNELHSVSALFQPCLQRTSRSNDQSLFQKNEHRSFPFDLRKATSTDYLFHHIALRALLRRNTVFARSIAEERLFSTEVRSSLPGWSEQVRRLNKTNVQFDSGNQW